MIIYILYYLVFKILSSLVRDSPYHDTSFNPQNLRNIIKKVAKISITQINYYQTCLSKQPYFAFFDIPQILQV